MNARQQNHQALLGLSACSGQLGIVKPLVERGADVLAVNGDGQTPYQLPLQRCYREVTELLPVNGAGGARSEKITLVQYSLNATSDGHFNCCRWKQHGLETED